MNSIGLAHFTYSLPLIVNKTINAIKKKIAKNNTDHCIEFVIEINNPNTNMPKTMAIFSVTS